MVKKVMGLYIALTKSKLTWVNIFDSIKVKGVKDNYPYQWMEYLVVKIVVKAIFHKIIM